MKFPRHAQKLMGRSQLHITENWSCWHIGIAHAALQSFCPMLRAALSRIKSHPCQSTWSSRSLLRQVFAQPKDRQLQLKGRSPATWLEFCSTQLKTSCHNARKEPRAGLPPTTAAEGLFGRDRTWELTTWRKLLVVGDPKCVTSAGATLMPIANGDLADPRNSAEDCSCSDSLASQVSCPARLSRSVPAYFRLHRNKSPRPMADKNVGGVSRGGRPNDRKVQVHSRGGGGFAPFFVRPFVRRGGQTFVTSVCAQPPQSFYKSRSRHRRRDLFCCRRTPGK